MGDGVTWSTEMDFRHLDDDWRFSLIGLDHASDTPWSAEQWSQALADQRVWVWGGIDSRDATLVSLAVLARLPFDAELQRLEVRPDWRRLGIARRMLNELCHEASKWGSERLLLEVRAGNEAALALYRQMGFVEDGRRRHYYPPARNATDGIREREDAVLMSRHP
ncbi:GNAT family N-acetyltransferase [Aidingimonas lacisalsi]|uniref:GNAT family N-acetyltransferase n=1 Tax=Aidingimonas lacisalsi TaxID=2604086 RepID=UPI001F01A063|nr:GNAT family N-acetyltransferase [Aidingimonas lacisalsi]